MILHLLETGKKQKSGHRSESVNAFQNHFFFIKLSFEFEYA